MTGSSRRSVLFYAAWPLGYHNVEAERKAAGLAAAGHDVVYVTGIGTRNPRLATLAKVVDRVGRSVGRVGGEVSAPPGVRSAAVLALPPRQFRASRLLNDRWMERRLRRAVTDWPSAVAWVRWPTPELVAALHRLRPAAVVYECVDPYHVQPGLLGRPWARVHERAERDLVALADRVVVCGETLAERFRGWGAEVEVLPHGVDLPEVPVAVPAGSTALDRPPTAGFVGTLDYRLDTALIRHLATSRPALRIRLIGPVQAGFDPGAVADLPGVTVEPPIPHTAVASTMAQFDVGLMPYVDDAIYAALTPLKTLEFLAAGLPVVARPSPAVLDFAEELHLARDPDDFVAALDAALASPPEAADRRRAAVAAHTWRSRIDRLEEIVDEVTAPAPPAGPATFAVAVCTRNRPELLKQTLDALADQDDRDFDVIVVDQSTEFDEDLRSRAAGDPRLRVVLDTGNSGLSRSRNIAWRSVDTDWVAYMDDDGLPDRDWTAQLRRILTEQRDVDFVGGSVEASDVPEGDDYLEVSAQEQPVAATFRGRWVRPWALGLGIGMVVRRSAAARLEGWDERLGPGAPVFVGGEDMDFNYRLLRGGGSGFVTPDLRVRHVQWRTTADLTERYADYMFGWTAFAVKQLKTGDVLGGGWLWLLGAQDAARMTASAVRRRSPLRARVARAKLRALARGTWEAGRAKW